MYLGKFQFFVANLLDIIFKIKIDIYGTENICGTTGSYFKQWS